MPDRSIHEEARRQLFEKAGYDITTRMDSFDPPMMRFLMDAEKSDREEKLRYDPGYACQIGLNCFFDPYKMVALEAAFRL